MIQTLCPCNSSLSTPSCFSFLASPWHIKGVHLISVAWLEPPNRGELTVYDPKPKQWHDVVGRALGSAAWLYPVSVLLAAIYPISTSYSHMIFSPWASILAFHWLKWAWNLACIWHIVKTWEMVVFFLFKKFHQILEFKRAANSADKCFKSVTAGYFSGPAPHTCINNRTRKHKSWNSFCGGWNITLLLPKSNMWNFPTGFLLEMTQWGKWTLSMYFLKDES